MVIELKNLKHYPRLSDETNAFSADLYVDGKKAADCSDDGRGGCIRFETYHYGNELYNKAVAYCKTLPPVTGDDGRGGTYSLEMDLELFVGEIVMNDLVEKDKKRFKTKMEKDMKKYILYGTEEYYTMRGWVSITIDEMLKKPKGKEVIQKTIDDIKSKLMVGERILNTNLPDSITL